MYRAIGLLRSETDFTLDEVQKRLTTTYPDASISRAGDQITVSKGEWWIALAVVSGPEIAEEIEGLLSRLAGVETDEAQGYVASAKRIEVWTDVSDPFMEHFNDYLLMVETLKSFNGLLTVDPNEPGVL